MALNIVFNVCFICLILVLHHTEEYFTQTVAASMSLVEETGVARVWRDILAYSPAVDFHHIGGTHMVSVE